MTLAELRALLIQRKAKALADGMVFSDIAQGVAALSASGKEAIVNAAKSRDAASLGSLVLDAVSARLQGVAQTEVDGVLADGSLSAAELQGLFP